MSEALKQVFQRAIGDSQFAKELLFDDPEAACKKVGILLNQSEIVILGDAMQDIQTHFLEKLYTISHAEGILAVNQCMGCD